MFRSFIYLDQEKMYSYLRQIDADYANQPVELSKKKTRGGSFGTDFLGVNAGIEIEEKREVTKDVINDYDRFEKKLEELSGSEYFDLVLDDYDINTVPRMSIIRVNGSFEIPEEFDMFSVAQKFMPLITSQIETSSDNERELMEAFLGKASADIPIVMEDEEVTISSKLSMPEFDGICSADCYVMQVKENINKEYLYWFILSEYFLKQAIACSMRTKMPKVNQNEINSFKINVPSLREQSGIVKTLKTYEDYCELLQKLIKQKVKYFESLAEQLLNGKIRISNSTDKWKKVKIGQFIDEINEKTTHNNQYEILSVTKNGICLQKDQFNKQIASNDNIGYKIVKKGNLVFSTMNLWMGSLDVLNSYNIGMVSPAYKVFKFNSNIMLNEFGKYYMKSKHMIWRYKINSEQGASVVRRNLDLKGLLNNVVSIPTVYEQRKIAEILMAVEKEIKLLEEKMQYVQQEKKAMMKLLLSGTVRMNEIYGDELYG